jgi:hypothetical protein
MREGDKDKKGIWERKKLVGDEDVKEVIFPERLNQRVCYSVMVRRRETLTEVRNKHAYGGVTSTKT